MVQISGIFNNFTERLQPQTSGTSAANGTNPNQGAAGQAGGASAEKTDQASLSSHSLAAAMQQPDADVRMDKVNSVRAAIESGTYHVSADTVAGKMIDNLLG